MIKGQKHLIPCRCILPQFRKLPEPIFHQFVVFSILDDDKLRPKIVQCLNCGILHKVTDLCSSSILDGKENSQALVTISDIKSSLSESLAAVLETHDADLASWEAVKFIVDNQRWGDLVVLTSDLIDDLRQGKYVRILGESLFKIDTFTRTEIISRS